MRPFKLSAIKKDSNEIQSLVIQNQSVVLTKEISQSWNKKKARNGPVFKQWKVIGHMASA